MILWKHRCSHEHLLKPLNTMLKVRLLIVTDTDICCVFFKNMEQLHSYTEQKFLHHTATLSLSLCVRVCVRVVYRSGLGQIQTSGAGDDRRTKRTGCEVRHTKNTIGVNGTIVFYSYELCPSSSDEKESWPISRLVVSTVAPLQGSSGFRPYFLTGAFLCRFCIFPLRLLGLSAFCSNTCRLS